jgi:hypothetical protein
VPVSLSSWWTFAVVLAAGGFGLWRLFRSFRHWPQQPPMDPEAKQAEARLWSTMNVDQA